MEIAELFVLLLIVLLVLEELVVEDFTTLLEELEVAEKLELELLEKEEEEELVTFPLPAETSWEDILL